jgi:hypothetical protein
VVISICAALAQRGEGGASTTIVQVEGPRAEDGFLYREVDLRPLWCDAIDFA